MNRFVSQFTYIAVVLSADSNLVIADDVPLPRHPLVYVGHSDVDRKDYDIWQMCGDRTQIASVVVGTGQQSMFSISPDGNDIAYISRTKDGTDIWRRKFSGGEATNLTQNKAVDSGPAFAPDGMRLAFFSNRDAEKPELYLMKLSDSAVTRLTTNTVHDSGASWSPDGRTIVFTRYFPKTTGKYDGAGEIMALDLASGKETQLTTLGGYNGGACHAPDGKRIAFHHVGDDGVELWVMNADGTGPEAITKTQIDEYSPAWSPDGNWIAYTAGTNNDGDGTYDLWLIRPDGSRKQVINTGVNTQMSPAWRPGDQLCR